MPWTGRSALVPAPRARDVEPEHDLQEVTT
jgi:hypothetical protein